MNELLLSFLHIMNNRIIQLYKPVYYLSKIFDKKSSSMHICKFLLSRSYSNQMVFNSSVPRIPPEYIRLDMKKIENLYRNPKKKLSFNQLLWECYMQNSDLVTYATYLIQCVCSRTRNSQTTNLLFDVIKSLDDFISENNVLFSPTIDQTTDVLISVLTLKNYYALKLVCSLFKIHEDPSKCKKFIQDLIEQQKYTEVALIVSALHLQNEYDSQEILYPLLLEGNVYAALAYLNDQPDLQIQAVKFLDNYLDPHATVHDVKSRRAYKTLKHLINVYKIPIDHCSKLQFIRSRSAVSVLINRRIQRSVSEATWEETIKNIIGENEDLKRFLIKKLVRKKDIKTARKMSEQFNINDPDLFIEMNDELNENSNNLNDQSEELDMIYDSTENYEDYLKFSLTSEDIWLVDNKEAFISSINEICQNYEMIGIDSEWKPHFGLSRDKLAVIQIAGHDKVYIFDILLLSECLETQDWDLLLDNIFGNPNIIKLGCGIMSDVNMILESIKGTKGKTVKFSHILDMALFYLKLQEVYPLEMKMDSEKDFTKSLSSLCDIVLGKPLSKEERLCDWEKRPLQTKQLEYAALDAHCLLQIYDKLKEEAEIKDMNFHHLSKVAIVVTTSQWKPKRRYKGKRSGKEFHVQKLVPIDQLKLVMDSAFEKSGKELRKLGADVVILDKTNTADFAIEISKAEDRMIICSNEMYNKVKHSVSEGVCFNFESSGDDLKVTQILEHFNVQMAAKSIYARCINCNSKDGVKLLPEDLKTLLEVCKKTNSLNSSIENNLALFRAELQKNFSHILKSSINITLSSERTLQSVNELAFLCKNCGSIC